MKGPEEEEGETGREAAVVSMSWWWDSFFGCGSDDHDGTIGCGVHDDGDQGEGRPPTAGVLVGAAPANERDEHEEEEAWERAVSRLFRCRVDGVDCRLPSSLANEERGGDRDDVAAAASECWYNKAPPPPPSAIRHVKQRDNWDCGIACVQMVFDWLGGDGGSSSSVFMSGAEATNLSAAGVDQEDRTRADILEAVQTRSVWTVDLVLLLDRYIKKNMLRGGDDQTGVGEDAVVASYLFTSTTLEVNAAFSEFAYYQKAFDRDKERVRCIFEIVRREQMPVLRVPNLSLERVVRLVSRPNCIAIVLVDNSILTGGDPCRRRKPATASNDSIHPSELLAAGEGDAKPASTYAGHYILLTDIVPKATTTESSSPTAASEGTNNSSDGEDRDVHNNDDGDHPAGSYPYSMAIVNPANDQPRTIISARRFLRAWKAPGTDEDVIFIVKHNNID